jgi:drug/metabolite transporter (DMT)-like permease
MNFTVASVADGGNEKYVSAVVEPLFPARGPPAHRRPLLGYAMVWTAATLFAVNGTVSKVILESGVSSLRLAQVRSTGALFVLGVLVLLAARRTLRVGRGELAFLAVYGIAGLALMQLLYFLAIHRLPIGIALLIQYLAPLLVALWARFVTHEPVRRRVWAALALALGGLTLVVEIWGGLALDGWGVAAALAGAVAFAAYVLMAERGVRRRDPVSLSLYGFLFATLFWALVQPWWSFPFAIVGAEVSLLGNLSERALPGWTLMAWMIVLGTIVPFWLVVGALRHIAATRVGIVAMLEPVVAAIVAFAWLDESLAAAQLVGGGIVLAGILLAQTAR